MMNMKIMTRNVLHPLWNYHAMVPALFLFAVLMLSACSSGNGLIGAKNAPDEFEVVIRPPLTLPPNFTLRPNDDNDDETASVSRANTQASVSAIGQSQKLFGTNDSANASSFEELFGTDQIIPNIRNIIDEETLGIQLDRRVPLEQIFGGQPEVGPDLDAAAEAYRIRQAIKDGQPLTDTPTFANDPLDNIPLTIE
jgi:hypothetical protein